MDLRHRVSNYIIEFLDYCQRESNLSNKTISGYKNALNIFKNSLLYDNSDDLEYVFYSSIVNYSICIKKYSKSTLYVHLIAVGLFLKYLESKYVIEHISEYYTLDRMNYYLNNPISEDNELKIQHIKALNTVSKVDIEHILYNLVYDAFNSNKSFVKQQRMFLDAVILIFNYYFVFSNEYLLTLKNLDVVIDNDIIKICKVDNNVSNWFILKNKYCIEIIKKYYSMSSVLINELGYFLVNYNTRKILNLNILKKTMLCYEKYNKNSSFQINNRNIIRLRLIHLLKEDKSFNYIQNLFLYKTEVLLNKIKFYNKVCNIKYGYNSEIHIIM